MAKKAAQKKEVNNDGKELFEALKLLEAEKGIPVDFMIDKIKKAIATACKNSYGNEDVVIDMDPESGKFDVFLRKEIVEEVENPNREIALEIVKQYDPRAEIGGFVRHRLDTKQFGRVAAQTARNIIRQGIRDSERDQMMQEFKEAFTTAQPSKEVGIHPQNYSEGGEEVLEQKVALMAEFGLTTEMLDFNIDDFSVEELREKFEALKTTGSEPAANAGNPESFALEGQFRDELFGALESEKVETCWGMDSHYWFWDYDRDASEVYATDVTDWNLYGFPYSMDGDHVVIDFAGKKRMKLSLVPFDEGGQADPISGMFAKITEKYSANDTQWAEKYQTASDTISSMENELGTLRQFKTDTEDAAAKGEREKVFAQFEDLVGVEAFENLREHCTEYAVDVLEEKCYAIRGRNGTAAKFSVEPKSPKLVVEKTSVTPEPYGGVFTEYGIASRNQHN